MSSQAWGACSLPGPAHLHNGCQVTQRGRSKNKRERESAEKERGRGRGRTFGCGKMPSAHSLTQPRPAFQRLCTCKSVIRLCSQEREHVLLFHFWLVFFERFSFHYCCYSTTAHIAPFSRSPCMSPDCKWLRSCSTTLPYHSVTVGEISALACVSTLQPTFKQETHP